jgi:4-amino-4-deoxy-L-arabinose transferase-like glycosyltransferase
MKTQLRWGVIALSFIWLAIVYASFYLVQQQRPFSATNARAVWSVLQDLLVAGLIVLVATGLGRRLCKWAGLRTEWNAERLILGCGLGLGTLACVVLAAGMMGWLAPWIAVAFLGGLGLLLLPDLLATVQAIREIRISWPPSWGMRAYLAGTLLLTALVALTPPLDWDGLLYHLTMPKLYMEQGYIAPVTDMSPQYHPCLMEMLYLLAMLLKGDVAAKLLHCGFMLLLAGLVYLLAERHIGMDYGWTAVAVYAAIPMVAVLGGWAYSDLALAFYQMGALYALFSWFQKRSQGSPAWPWLAISAAFCGFAMGLKYTSFVCPVVVVFLISWHLVRTRARWKQWVRALLTFGIVALVAAAPWYLRNLAATGNPVYPFAYGLFGGEGWDAWRAAWYAQEGTGIGWDVAELLKLPWTLTLGVRDMTFFDSRMGPLFLLALPFLVAWYLRLYDRDGTRPPAVLYLGVFALAQYLVWTAGVVASRSLFQSRLLLPAFVALCGPLAYLFGRLRVLDTRHLSLRLLIGMTVVLVLAANLSTQFLATLRISPLPVLFGQESREEFLSRNLQAHYAAMGLVNERVPEGGYVLFLWEPRSYYSKRAVQPDPILERWGWLLYQHGGDLDAVASALREEGYTHVLHYRAGMESRRRSRLDPLTEEDFAAWDAFAASHLQEEARVGEAYSLYRWRAAS